MAREAGFSTRRAAPKGAAPPWGVATEGSLGGLSSSRQSLVKYAVTQRQAGFRTILRVVAALRLRLHAAPAGTKDPV